MQLDLILDVVEGRLQHQRRGPVALHAQVGHHVRGHTEVGGGRSDKGQEKVTVRAGGGWNTSGKAEGYAHNTQKIDTKKTFNKFCQVRSPKKVSLGKMSLKNRKIRQN